jgi:EAL domain-containing protein (putative c-di-GMP-specific phosphodiesterase class I)
LADPGEAAARRILVVERDEGDRALLLAALRGAGHPVVAVPDLDAAAAAVRDASFDAALVDRAGGDGITFLHLLAGLQPGCLRILLTDDAASEALIAVLNRGDAARVLARPLDPLVVLEAVGDAFRSARRLEHATTERMIESHRQERRWFDETVSRDLLMLALQPIVEVGPSGFRTVAYEALLRTRHPAWPLPEPVLVVAERLARVPDLGARVFELAAEVLPLVPEPLGLFVNLHPVQLADPRQLLRDLAPLVPFARRVTLEITERAHPLSLEAWDPVVERLNSLGFSLAIDDLGAGSSSLVLLATLQPQAIKLDMTLVRGIDLAPRKRRLVQLLVTFAEATGARLLAEGVESEGEMAALYACGVTWMQGYLFGRPAPAADLSA